MSFEDRSGRLSPGPPDDDEEKQLSWTQIEHLVHAPFRRPRLVVLPWIGVFALSVVALFVLPKKYRSSTLILIESEKVPEAFVPRMPTQDTSHRIEDIKPEILSRTRLERVLAETNPYPNLQSKTRAVDAMREAIAVNQSGSDGFTIEFVHKDPRKAQEVTERLATLFISETVTERERRVGDAVDFLAAQVADARKEVEQKDESLRRYKESRMGQLPQQLDTNLATMQMLQRELESVEESLYLAREKQDALARDVGHPTLTQAGGAGPQGASDVDELRAQLRALRTRYTDEHPDVKRLMALIAAAEIRQAQAQAQAQASAPEAAASTDYDSITRAQFAKAQQEVQKLEQRESDVGQRIASLRERIEATPRTEEELANMTRDYQKLNENYTALLAKQMEAQMAGRLEQRWKGDQFRMLDPASLPERPESPRPLPIMAIGAVLGLFAGLGTAVAAELLDPTLKDAEQLEALCTVLGRISHIQTLQGPSLLQ